MNRVDILNELITKYGYTKYLEIGVQRGKSFNNVKVKEKIGVDPDSNAGANFCMTSDKFFRKLNKNIIYDIFFLDGLHESPQLYKDITNSLNHLADNGIIVCHDCNPQKEIEQRVPRANKRWNGNVWKDIVQIRKNRDDIEIYTIDADEGCCVIRKGKSKKLKAMDNPKYSDLEKNREKWLNLISVNEFLKLMGHNLSYKIWEFVPYGLEDKNYGRSSNEYCELIKNDDDVIIIRDTDCCSLTPSHVHVIKNAIENAPSDWGMLIPWSSRIGQKRQVYDVTEIENSDMRVHRDIALKLVKQPLKFIPFDRPISGMIMIFKKSTWKQVNGFRSGLLGVDTTFSNRIRRAGLKIYLVNQLYFMHYYRLNEGMSHKEHLR